MLASDNWIASWGQFRTFSEQLDVNIAVANLTRKYLGGASFAATSAIFKPDVPPVPATNDFAKLHHSFT